MHPSPGDPFAHEKSHPDPVERDFPTAGVVGGQPVNPDYARVPPELAAHMETVEAVVHPLYTLKRRCEGIQALMAAHPQSEVIHLLRGGLQRDGEAMAAAIGAWEEDRAALKKSEGRLLEAQAQIRALRASAPAHTEVIRPAASERLVVLSTGSVERIAEKVAARISGLLTEPS